MTGMNTYVLSMATIGEWACRALIINFIMPLTIDAKSHNYNQKKTLHSIDILHKMREHKVVMAHTTQNT